MFQTLYVPLHLKSMDGKIVSSPTSLIFQPGFPVSCANWMTFFPADYHCYLSKIMIVGDGSCNSQDCLKLWTSFEATTIQENSRRIIMIIYPWKYQEAKFMREIINFIACHRGKIKWWWLNRWYSSSKCVDLQLQILLPKHNLVVIKLKETKLLCGISVLYWCASTK